LAPEEMDKRVGLNVKSDKASGLPPLGRLGSKHGAMMVGSVRGYSRDGSRASRDFSHDG